MRRLVTIFAVFALIAFLQVSIFAETSSGHQHEEGEECACELAEAKDITVSAEELQTIEEELRERLSNLEEITNMLYELIGSKLSSEDFEVFTYELKNRLADIEQELLNLKATTETGLPTMRDMIYELSSNLASLENRLTEYINLAVAQASEEVKAKIFDETNQKIADIEVTLDIHDSDILKLYDITSTLTNEIQRIEASIPDVSPLQESIETISLRVGMHDQDIVNIFDALSTKANLSDIEELSSRLQNLEEVVNSYQNSDVSDRISLLEEYANMIYDTLNTKASLEDVEQQIAPLKEEMNNISSALQSITTKVNSQDVDIIKLYNSIAQLTEELQRLAGRLSLIETMVRELYQKSGK
ncbi:hypothetical protein Ferpe_1377 [Fervidobacterium pennivorans DSM 9078]|jgi:hypothetical protein|uniref:Uncharacterized protein n=1 Tax=Fervidobacterium pennivorans (strain DSM 9078 / Ven5) TaxID=771875 RepID=H9UD60_FERPD|nr:hypothetical protein [Fervidobacterium pennivorans]AFG35453.1 hypothetical protein Ferpe_1377 [Fervidobacterium pennivorans DSM 9078]QIV78908.1 hypothetical protein HER11_08230 [Fervidobacterium pennivorans subsp. keratinolyticus]